MECEICGKEIEKQSVITKIDGSIMKVCDECSKFGKVQKIPPKPKQVKKSSPQSKRSVSRIRKTEEEKYELVEDYAKLIRENREKKGWSREELGAKLNEKVSVISKIETRHMPPDIKLSKKIEKLLKLNLLEKVEDLNDETYDHSNTKSRTIGDIAFIKK